MHVEKKVFTEVLLKILLDTEYNILKIILF